MIRTTIQRLFAGAVVLGFCWWLFQRLPGLPVGLSFPLTLVTGFALGLLILKYFVPRVAETVVDLAYSGGGNSEEDPDGQGKQHVALSLMARGDFQGAVEAYHRTLKMNPDDLHAIGEIAKIQAEHLSNPAEAIGFLRSQLSARPWPQDGEVFILFRIAGIERNVRHDRAAAREVMEQVMSRFPKTRHSANARHKLEEWQREESREEQIQRRKLAV